MIAKSSAPAARLKGTEQQLGHRILVRVTALHHADN